VSAASTVLPKPGKKIETASPKEKGNTAALALGALGVVFGDIGTSPLYALRQCFKSLHSAPPDPASILGILSLVFWSLILVVCVKYLTFITRADHDGEGGTLAMLALIHTKRPPKKTASPGVLILMVLFGSALLYGDGVITPAISVLSAVEGLKMATPGVERFVVPIALTILIGLFLLQRRGTGQVGNLFGPVMTVWFLAIAALGVAGILQAPRVLAALNPGAAIVFLATHGGTGIIVMGAVVLCFSGAEALFADLSHFGQFPIRLAWYALVLPALLLNYFGQGALILNHPAETRAPFFALVPHELLLPTVGLATLATIIASQALISGAFSLTEQAIHMGYFPRFNIIHTSKKQRGQVYIGVVNYGLMLACIAIVLAFRSSENLGGAYGLAVIGTMTITSLTYFVVLREVWKWPGLGAAAIVACFLAFDLAFLAGNLVKIVSGAWVPLVIALAVFAVLWIWTSGGIRYSRALHAWGMPVEDFLRDMKGWKHRQEGTAVFFTTHRDFVPLVGKNHWLRKHVRHEQVLLVSILEKEIPYVPESEMSRLEELGPGFWRVTGSFGFMQHPDITRLLECQSEKKLALNWDKLVCYLPEASFVDRGGWWKRLIEDVYKFLRHNSLSAARYFRIPPVETVLIGVRLQL
jgi:KUP system potassium uptake protein